MQPLYTTLKVNNEIELCEVSDPDCKQLIERALLKNRISYYIRWPKASLFSRKKGCLHHLHQRQCQGCCGRNRPRDL